MKERIVVSSDHAGFELKHHLKPFIESLGYELEDIGTFDKEPVDYPIFTLAATQKIISGDCSRGISNYPTSALVTSEGFKPTTLSLEAIRSFS